LSFSSISGCTGEVSVGKGFSVVLRNYKMERLFPVAEMIKNSKFLKSSFKKRQGSYDFNVL